MRFHTTKTFYYEICKKYGKLNTANKKFLITILSYEKRRKERKMYLASLRISYFIMISGSFAIFKSRKYSQVVSS